jgi:plasmid stability protein
MKATLTIRNLDPGTKSRLRVRAARHARSMEEEAREILKAAVASTEEQGGNLAEAIRRRLEPLGGVELEVAPRDPLRAPPRFGPR